MKLDRSLYVLLLVFHVIAWATTRSSKAMAWNNTWEYEGTNDVHILPPPKKQLEYPLSLLPWKKAPSYSCILVLGVPLPTFYGGGALVVVAPATLCRCGFACLLSINPQLLLLLLSAEVDLRVCSLSLPMVYCCCSLGLLFYDGVFPCVLPIGLLL